MADFGKVALSQIGDLSEKIKDTVNILPMPTKTGVNKTSPKLVQKNSKDEYTVIQATNKGYVEYQFTTLNGDSSNVSVGGTWDLLRLQKATVIGEPILAKETYDSVVGTLQTYTAPSVNNDYDKSFIQQPFFSDCSVGIPKSSKGNGYGLGVYGLTGTSVTSVTWKIKANRKIRKGNVLIWGTAGSSQSADILVNGKVVKSFDATTYYDSTNAKPSAAIIEFDLPLQNSISPYGGDITITLRNNDITGKGISFSAINVVPLSQWKGEEVDFWKYPTYDNWWIFAAGASDYAIYDKDLGKYCGSYHGGETRLSGKITWNKTGYPYFDVNLSMVDLSDSSIADGSWCLLNTLKVEQETNINNKGNMLTIYEFDTDGTLGMNFSFYNGTINVTQFFTGLTAAHRSFNELLYPQKITLGGINGNVSLNVNEGFVIQRNPVNNLDLAIRHTKFSSKYNLAGTYLYDNPASYRKYYYALVDAYTKGVTISNVSFRKCLDFIKN